ncbi:MAG: hypothetical protein LBK98_10015 [Peptococcaceae bacterium]|jgi:hypothetical protein|nr:hypothetical protein [Peptococcaceae bacterium]
MGKFAGKIGLLGLALALAGALVLVGCGGSGQAAPAKTDTLSGELPDILTAILDGAEEIMGEAGRLGMTFNEEVTAEGSQGMLGLTAEQFELYVDKAYASNAAIISIAHEVALIKCKDFDAAAEVKALAAGGFDPLKWVCVVPERCFVMDSGSYVLLAATALPIADALGQSFEALADGNAGETNVFYTSE